LKKGGFIFIAIAMIVLAAGCASTKSTNLLSQNDPIALVSVVSNWDINWTGEAPEDPRLSNPISAGARRNDPDLAFISNAETLINTAEAFFREAVSGSTKISLAEKERALSSSAYKNADISSNLIRKEYISADGFRLISYQDKKFPAALAQETGIQRSMFLEFNFTKTMTNGFGKSGVFRPEVSMLIVILDSRGKTILRKTFTSWSLSTLRVNAGTYSQSALMMLFEQPIQDVCHDFIDFLSK
jgi:hypothetical protein